MTTKTDTLRQLFNATGVPLAQIGKRAGVHEHVIHSVIRRDLWTGDPTKRQAIQAVIAEITGFTLEELNALRPIATGTVGPRPRDEQTLDRLRAIARAKLNGTVPPPPPPEPCRRTERLIPEKADSLQKPEEQWDAELERQNPKAVLERRVLRKGLPVGVDPAKIVKRTKTQEELDEEAFERERKAPEPEYPPTPTVPVAAPALKDIARILRAARKKAGLSQNQLGQLIGAGANQTAVCTAEIAGRVPTAVPDYFAKALAACGLPEDWQPE